MEYTKVIKHEINGVYGNVTYGDINLNGNYYPSRYNSEERSLDTRETISSTEELNGLPEGLSMDDYFKMALLQKFDSIEKKLDNLQNVSVNVTLDNISNEFLMKLASLLYGESVKIK